MKAVLLTLLLLAPAVGRAADNPEPPRILASRNIRWNKAPAEHGRASRWGYATVLYFGADGKFGMVDCVLNRDRRTLAVNRGDGLNIHVGRWSDDAGVSKVDYRLVERSTPRIGEKLPGRTQTARVGLRRGRGKGSSPTRLSFLKKMFVPDRRLAADEVRSLFAQYWQH